MKLQIVTAEKVIYEDDVDQVTVPTKSGDIGILPKHSPLVSILRPGELIIEKDGQKVYMAVSLGFVEVRRGEEVVVLADTAERSDDIDLERAEKARKRAEDLLNQKDIIENVEHARFIAKLERELARIKVARKHKI